MEQNERISGLVLKLKLYKNNISIPGSLLKEW